MLEIRVEVAGAAALPNGRRKEIVVLRQQIAGQIVQEQLRVDAACTPGAEVNVEDPSIPGVRDGEGVIVEGPVSGALNRDVP